jgi:2-polyprenyl-3-methyl-5-hydroxy-6-metoxy-1,4-benzoquinol methylase
MQAHMMETLDACPVCSGKTIACEHAGLELWRCADCGAFFNNPRPTKSFIEKNYNEGEHYLRFTPDEKWNEFWARRMERVLKHRPRPPILDISAGIGTAVKQLRDRGFECNGSEISKEAIARARELYGLELMEGYPEELTLGRGSLGCLMMWHVFEHLPFPGRALLHLADRIATGGLLVIAVPNSSFARLARHGRLWFAARRAKLEALYTKIDYTVKFQEIHLIHFTPASLRRIVEAAGFTVVEHGVDNVLSKWRDAKLPLRNLAARLGFNDAPAMLLIARKTGAPAALRA